MPWIYEYLSHTYPLEYPIIGYPASSPVPAYLTCPAFGLSHINWVYRQVRFARAHKCIPLGTIYTCIYKHAYLQPPAYTPILNHRYETT